jgi:hypothetical protein
MNTHSRHANRLRRRRGLSQSALRKIEAIVALGPRAVRRQFVAADRDRFGGRYDQ